MTTEPAPTICCFGAMAGAGINAGMQLLCSVIGLSSASLVLSHEKFWRFAIVMLDSGGERRHTTEKTTFTGTSHFTPQYVIAQQQLQYTPPSLPTPPPLPTPFPPPAQVPPFYTSCVPHLHGYALYTPPPTPPRLQATESHEAQLAEQHQMHGYKEQQLQPHYYEPDYYHFNGIHIPTPSSVSKHLPKTRKFLWINAAIEMSMTWYVGYANVWILSLIGVFLSFRFHRPVLLVPNLVALCAGIIFNGAAFGSLLAWSISTEYYYNPFRSSDLTSASSKDSYEEHVLMFVMCSFFINFLLNLVFIQISMRYYFFLERKCLATLKRVHPAPLSGAHSSSAAIENDVEKS